MMVLMLMLVMLMLDVDAAVGECSLRRDRR
jgi:hypothetical protein